MHRRSERVASALLLMTVMQRSWMLIGCLVLASCAQFTGTPAPSDDAADTTKPKKGTTTTTSATSSASSTTTPAPSATFNPADTTVVPQPDDLWPVAGETVAIPVCFEAGFTSDNRAIAKETATTMWGMATALQFIGWQACAPSEVSVHLTPASDGSSSHVVQVGLETLSTQVFINVNQDDTSFAADVLHELGHVAGLGHEELSNANDRANCNSMITAEGITSDLPGSVPTGRGVDDRNSIMSRCRDSNDPIITSADIAAIARLYGVTGDGLDD